MADVVLTEVADRVATVTLNRPEARNALNSEVLKALPAALSEVDADDEVDVLILTGADPAFCAGLDLKELGSGGGLADASQEPAAAAGSARGGGGRGDPSEAPAEAEGSARGEGSQSGAGRGPLPPGPKPVIGAINGAAITG